MSYIGYVSSDSFDSTEPGTEEEVYYREVSKSFPLIEGQELPALLRREAALSILLFTFRALDPFGYVRIVLMSLPSIRRNA